MQTAPAPFTGRKMLYAMLAFFAVIIAANLIMMTFAISTHTGTVVPNSYVASQDFNARIAADREQRRLGWRADLSYEGRVANLTFRDRAGAPLAGLTVAGVIGRPVSAAHDRPLAFRETAPGIYVADVELAAGDWRLEAEAVSTDGVRYRLIRDVHVASERAK